MHILRIVLESQDERRSKGSVPLLFSALPKTEVTLLAPAPAIVPPITPHCANLCMLSGLWQPHKCFRRWLMSPQTRDPQHQIVPPFPAGLSGVPEISPLMHSAATNQASRYAGIRKSATKNPSNDICLCHVA